LAGKVLVRLTSKAAAEYLVGEDQFGVGVPNGCEAVVHAATAVAAAMAAGGGCLGGEPVFVLKTDCSNAFNRMKRSKMAAAVLRVLPLLARYLFVAYGGSTHLVFEEELLASLEGAQQGDPLGPLFFSLGLADLWREIKPLLASPLKFAAWLLDDGVFCGTAEALTSLVDLLVALGPAYGVHPNLKKCTLFGDDIPADLLPGLPSSSRAPLAAFTHLGAYCGPDAVEKDRFVAKAVSKVAQQMRVFGVVAAEDPLAAYSLLRACGHRSALNYLLRCCGSAPCLSVADAAVDVFGESLWGSTSLPLSAPGPPPGVAPLAHQQIALPIRFGGFGLVRVSILAPVALFASLLASIPVFPSILSPAGAAHLISSPVLATFPKATSTMEAFLQDTESKSVRGAQKKISAVMASEAQAALKSSCPRVDEARLVCLEAKTTGLWLCPPPAAVRAGVWMAPAVFRMSCRLRLGLPLADVESLCVPCASRGRPPVLRDVFGHHALACMLGGERTHAHNTVCRQLVADASFGLLHPAPECHPFGDGDRLDFVFRTGSVDILVDVALTFPLFERSLAAACSAPGGAATEYEKVKFRRYGSKVGPCQKLAPCVFDSFGGAGVSGRPVLDRIALCFSRRWGSRGGRAVFFTRLNVVVLTQVALIALGHFG
jgi:hypothetical protein